ncbi:MAG: hypothetical protein JWQ23_4160 [Herminiimonas sp.]|nr:hypothetical protein [Herminiimonas sp.]
MRLHPVLLQFFLDEAGILQPLVAVECFALAAHAIRYTAFLSPQRCVKRAESSIYLRLLPGGGPNIGLPVGRVEGLRRRGQIVRGRDPWYWRNGGCAGDNGTGRPACALGRRQPGRTGEATDPIQTGERYQARRSAGVWLRQVDNPVLLGRIGYLLALGWPVWWQRPWMVRWHVFLQEDAGTNFTECANLDIVCDLNEISNFYVVVDRDRIADIYVSPKYYISSDLNAFADFYTSPLEPSVWGL